MLRDEYLRRLTDAAHIELYLSANDGTRLYWPWRMHPPKEATRGYRNACERYIIDSDPLDDSVTATDVLDTAHRLGAEVASLQDVYQDKEGTVESLLRGFEAYDDHAFDGELLLPLQRPYAECWRELGEPKEHLLGIGGLKDATVADRLAATESLRSAVGSEPHIHGFGWGVHGGLAQRIREEPDLLDSIDYSTPMQNITYDYSNGEESMSVAAIRAASQLIEDLRDVSPFVSDDPEASRANGQGGLESWT